MSFRVDADSLKAFREFRQKQREYEAGLDTEQTVLRRKEFPLVARAKLLDEALSSLTYTACVERRPAFPGLAS
jgi:hypothetical protein